MARHLEDVDLRIQNARILEQFYTRMGINLPPLEVAMASRITPVAIVDQPDLTDKGKLAYGYGGPGATAAMFTYVQLFNPVDSGVTVFIEFVNVRAAADSAIFYSEFDTVLTTDVATKGFRDRRITGTPVAQVRTQITAASLGDPVMLVYSLAAESLQLPSINTILEEGQGVHFQGGTLNMALTASWLWREDPLLAL